MVHYRIAEALLTSAQARAETAGIKLDVGEFPNRGETIPADDDPERISKLTAHAVARISDHFPAFRKFSRHLEGTEKRAGLLSDLFAVVAALYKRNPDAIEDLARQFTTELQSRRAERASTNNGGTNATSSPMTQGKPKPGGIRAT